jgi:hypothetical protein
MRSLLFTIGSIMSAQLAKYEVPRPEVTSAPSSVLEAARAATWRSPVMSPQMERAEPNLQVLTAMMTCAAFVLAAPVLWSPPLTVMVLMSGEQ